MSGQTEVSKDYNYTQNQDQANLPTNGRMDESDPYNGFMNSAQLSKRQHVFHTVPPEAYPSYPAYNEFNAEVHRFEALGSTGETSYQNINSRAENQYVYSLQNDLQNTNCARSVDNANFGFDYTLKDFNKGPSCDFKSSLAKNNEEFSSVKESRQTVLSEKELVEARASEDKDMYNTQATEEKEVSVEPAFIKVEPLQDCEETSATGGEPMIVDIKQEVIEDEEEGSEKADSDNESDESDDEDSENTFDENDEESSEEESQKSTKKKKSASKNLKIRLNPFSPKPKQEFKCDICSRVVTSKRALEKHVNLHTGKYTCKTCGKFCNSQTSLDNHEKVHAGYVGSEVCKVCDKTFYDKSSLNKHTLSVHMGIKHFQCEYCEKSFYAKKTYQEHVRVHTGERPFKCDLCPKSYKRISDLNHHVRLHKGEVSVTCELCGEGYRRGSELKRHMQKHADVDTPVKPEPPNKCDWCDLKFSTKKALRQHTLIHMENMDSIDMINKMERARPKPDQFTSEKLKLVDNIVLGLGTGSIEHSLALQNQNNVIRANLSDSDESAIRMSLFGFSSFGMSTDQPLQPVATGSSCYLAGDMQPSTEKTLNINENITKIVQDTIKNIDKDLESSKRTVTETENVNEYTEELDEEPDEEPEPEDNEEDQTDFNNSSSLPTASLDPKLVVVKQEKFDIEIEHVNEISGDTAEDYADDYGGDTEIEASDDNDPEYMPEDIETPEDNINPPKKRKLKIVLKKNGNKKQKIKTTKKRVKKRKVEKEGEIEEETERKDQKGFVCEECGKSIATKSHFRKHMNLHTGEFFCESCNKSFTSKMRLDLHMDKHLGLYENTAKCKVCDKTFYDVSSLNKHVKNVHMNNRPFACTECDRKFSERKTLVEHMRVHTGERPFQCQICGRTFKRQGELNFHMKKHTGEIKITCSECGEGFRRQSELKTHSIIKHNGERPFICTLCGKGYMSNCLLQEHLHTHSDRSYECDKCGKGFHSRAKLAKHNRIKTDCEKLPIKVNGVYKCRYCFLEYIEIKELNTHIRNEHSLESGKRQFSCQVCKKIFGRSQSLNRHMKIHTQRRDYKCTICLAAFIQKHHLSQHIMTHTGEKPFKCEICGRGFGQKATLYSHMKHH